jgi:hypothetical protein
MAIIPVEQQFHTLTSSVVTADLGSTLANSGREIYTMQDIITTVAADTGSVEVDGSPKTGYTAIFASPHTIGGEYLTGMSSKVKQQYSTNDPEEGMLVMTQANYDLSGWWADADIEGNLIFDFGGPGTNEADAAAGTPITILNPSKWEYNVHIGTGIMDMMNDTSTYQRYNTVIGAGVTCQKGKGVNNQDNVIIGSDIDPGDIWGNCDSAVIIGSQAFKGGSYANPNYGVYIGKEILHSFGVYGTGNIAIGGSNVAGGTIVGKLSVLIGNETGYYYDKNNATDADGAYNTMIGTSSGRYYAGGANNTFIGYKTGPTSYDVTNDGDNNTCLGNEAKVANGVVSNEIVLGNASVTTLRCNVAVISALSDERDKTDIVDIHKGLDFVKELKPRKFTWDPREVEKYTDIYTTDEDGKDVLEEVVTMVKPATDGMKDVGFIAQELQTVDDDFLRLVSSANPDKLEASYGRLVPVLVKAIQELAAEVDALK